MVAVQTARKANMASIEFLKVKNGIHGLLLCLKEAEITKIAHLSSIATELTRIQGQAEKLSEFSEKAQAMSFCAFTSKAITASAMAMAEAYELASDRAEREMAKRDESLGVVMPTGVSDEVVS